MKKAPRTYTATFPVPSHTLLAEMYAIAKPHGVDVQKFNAYIVVLGTKKQIDGLAADLDYGPDSMAPVPA